MGEEIEMEELKSKKQRHNCANLVDKRQLIKGMKYVFQTDESETTSCVHDMKEAVIRRAIATNIDKDYKNM